VSKRPTGTTRKEKFIVLPKWRIWTSLLSLLLLGRFDQNQRSTELEGKFDEASAKTVEADVQI
jgi:hypothetical protein